MKEHNTFDDRFTCSLDCDKGKLNLVLRIKNNT